MNELFRHQLAQLSATLYVLQQRVRHAVAGEIGDAIANAFAEIVTQSLAGPAHASPYADDYEAWDDDLDTPSKVTPPSPMAEALFTVAVLGGRSLLLRQSLSWATLGLGLGAGLALCVGGPITRTVLGVVLSVERLRTSTDALRDSAHVLDRV